MVQKSSWVPKTVEVHPGQNYFLSILRYYLPFYRVDIYIDNAKAMLQKTAGDLV